jgi:zinc transport system substrate-binding protein
VLAIAACGDDDSTSTAGATTGSSAADLQATQLDVVASFYPLQFVVERIGGDRVDASNLTPAGAEPHDLELSARDTATLQEADLVVYLSGFAPALDDAIGETDGSTTLDVAAAARLDLTAVDDEEHADEADHTEDSSAAGDATGSGGSAPAAATDVDHEHEGVDPHFWLDPTRLADVADAVADRLAQIDPDDEVSFKDNAAALRQDLEALDGEFKAGLTGCANTSIVTSHTAFGYLAQRYGLTQVGISGLSPEEEPSPAKLAEVTTFVKDHDVSTIYYETLVDPAIADAVAKETGATTAVLDPIEGLTADTPGTDYLQVMRANLQTLRTGQHCP